MTQTATGHDVFISYSMNNASIAGQVAESLRAAGLQVFDMTQVSPGVDLQETLMGALAESSAMVGIVGSDGLSSPSTAVEIGAAWAWNKPVYVISAEANSKREELALMAGVRVYPLARIDEVIFAIKQALRPLSDKDYESLMAIYRSLRIPTDRFVSQPVSVDKLAKKFSELSGKSISGEKLVQELIRLRKQGRLPKLRKSG